MLACRTHVPLPRRRSQHPRDPLERGAILDAIALRDRLDAHIATAVGDYEAAGRHQIDGSLTMAAWLQQRAGMDPETANRYASRARKLHHLPVLRAASIDGALSAGAVNAILAKVPKRHLARFADHEAELVPLLADLDTDTITRAMRDWRAKADALDPGPAPAEKPDTLHASPTLDDRGQVNASLGSDLFNLLLTALRVADNGDLTMPLAQRRAHALGQVCQSFLDFNPAAKHRRHRPHRNVTMTLERFEGRRDAPPATYLDTGMPATEAHLEMLRCDGAWHRLTYQDRGTVLHYGRSRRDWPADLYNAIALRDGGCRWPGCNAPVHWCDVHHVIYWENGGHTDIDHGFLGCRRHHHLIHSNAGFTLKLLPDGVLEITRPDGTTERSYPRGLGWATGPAPPDDPG